MDAEVAEKKIIMKVKKLLFKNIFVFVCEKLCKTKRIHILCWRKYNKIQNKIKNTNTLFTLNHLVKIARNITEPPSPPSLLFSLGGVQEIVHKGPPLHEKEKLVVNIKLSLMLSYPVSFKFENPIQLEF